MSIQEINKLSIPERILLAEAIWDSVVEESPSIPITGEIKKMLDERLKAHYTNPTEGSSWEDVKKRVSDKL